MRLILAFYFASTIYCQAQSLIVTGYIKESESLTPIEEAIVWINNKTFTSNNEGVFMAVISPGNYKMIVNRLGYSSFTLNFNIAKDTTINVLLTQNTKLNEVFITGKLEHENASIVSLDRELILKIPALGGEKDIIKSFVLLPGIVNGSEGSSDIIVRGGSPDQNLILLENIPLYSSQHLFGFYSTINPLVVKNVDLYKGGFPGRYGGRLSSVIDIQTKSPDMDSISGQAELGLLSSKLQVDMPLIKNKLTASAAARRTYIDGLVGLVDKFQGDPYRNRINFHDIDMKLFYRARKLRTSLLYHAGRDNYSLIYDSKPDERYSESTINWGNKIVALNLDLSSGNWLNKLTLGVSTYRLSQFFDSKVENIIEEQVRQLSNMIDASIKYSADISVKKNIDLQWGAGISNLFFNPSRVLYKSEDVELNQATVPASRATNYGLFSEAKMDLDRLFLTIGIRFTYFNNQELSFYTGEPRINVAYDFGKNFSLKFSYSKMSQPLHQLANTGLGIPFNFWVNSTTKLRPELSDNLAINFSRKWRVNTKDINISIEPYFKKFRNTILFKDGFSSNTFANTSLIPENWSEVLTIGEGKSYGVEFMAEFRIPELRGWVTYTYSRVKALYPELNGGRIFNGMQDIPNQITLFGNYEITSKWALNLTWVFNTGRPLTISSSSFGGPLFDYATGSVLSSNIQYQMQLPTERNAFRMKNYHRLDISLSKRIKLFKKFDGVLDFGFYNLYNRRNPFYYYLKPETDIGGNTRVSLKSVSIFPILPQFSLLVNF